jgi:uncharacterized protein YcgI (DUF1989 family)
MDRVHVEAKHGAAFRLAEGETFEVIDTHGGQAVDVTVFPAADPTEGFSSKYTYRRTGKVRFEEGDSLYSIAGKPIATLVRDDCGINDLLLAPCNEWLVEEYYDQEDELGCRGNLQEVLEPHGVDPQQVQEVMNLFTKVAITDHTYLDFREPPSEPGDAAELRAERDAIVGVAPCTGDSELNDGNPTAIDIRVPGGTDVNTNF